MQQTLLQLSHLLSQLLRLLSQLLRQASNDLLLAFLSSSSIMSCSLHLMQYEQLQAGGEQRRRRRS